MKIAKARHKRKNMPITTTIFLPLILFGIQCRYDNGGIAWLVDWQRNVSAHVRPLCGSAWYDGREDYLPEAIATGAIPMMYSDSIKYYNRVADLNNVGYDGYVLAFNEPEQEGQADLSPQRAAAVFHIWEGTCPTCQWVALNGNFWGGDGDLNYVRQFIDAYRARTDELPRLAAWGIHLYFFGASKYEPGAATDRIDEFCTVLDGYGLPCQIWVTEYGTCQSPNRITELTHELASDSRVGRFFIFTNWWMGNCDPALFEFHTDNLTAIGREFKEAMVVSPETPLLPGLHLEAEREGNGAVAIMVVLLVVLLIVSLKVRKTGRKNHE